MQGKRPGRTRSRNGSRCGCRRGIHRDRRHIRRSTSLTKSMDAGDRICTCRYLRLWTPWQLCTYSRITRIRRSGWIHHGIQLAGSGIQLHHPRMDMRQVGQQMGSNILLHTGNLRSVCISQSRCPGRTCICMRCLPRICRRCCTDAYGSNSKRSTRYKRVR